MSEELQIGNPAREQSMACTRVSGSISHRYNFRSTSMSIDTCEQEILFLEWGQWTDDNNMNTVKSCREGLKRGLHMVVDCWQA